MTRHGQNLTQVEAMLFRLTFFCTLMPNSKPPEGQIPLPGAQLPYQHQADDAPSAHGKSNICRPPRCASCSRCQSGILKSP